MVLPDVAAVVWPQPPSLTIEACIGWFSLLGGVAALAAAFADRPAALESRGRMMAAPGIDLPHARS